MPAMIMPRRCSGCIMSDREYSRATIIWVLINLLELRQGIHPCPGGADSISSGYLNPHAPHEALTGLAGVIESRRQLCGADGLLVKVLYVMREPDSELALIAGCPVRKVNGHVDKVLNYVSGKWPKSQDYREFRRH